MSRAASIQMPIASWTLQTASSGEAPSLMQPASQIRNARQKAAALLIGQRFDRDGVCQVRRLCVLTASTKPTKWRM